MFEVTNPSVILFNEVKDPEAAKSQLTYAEPHLRDMTAEVKKWEAKVQVRQEQIDEDVRTQAFLYERITEQTRKEHELRESIEQELMTIREACDASGQSQRLRTLRDESALYEGTYAKMVERISGVHRLAHHGDLVYLYRAQAAEADALAMVSHLRTVISLEAAFKEEGRIGFVGQRTQDILNSAKALHDLADRTYRDFQAATTKFEEEQKRLAAAGNGRTLRH